MNLIFIMIEGRQIFVHENNPSFTNYMWWQPSLALMRAALLTDVTINHTLTDYYKDDHNHYQWRNGAAAAPQSLSVLYTLQYCVIDLSRNCSHCTAGAFWHLGNCVIAWYHNVCENSNDISHLKMRMKNNLMTFN